jgi:hypothetical protein
VTVGYSAEEIATEQVKLEEKRRPTISVDGGMARCGSTSG